MIICDTSVWVEYFNGLPSLETDTLDNALQEGIVSIGDLILLEVLQGFREDKAFAQAKALLSSLDVYSMLGQAQAVNAAANYRKLRKKGVTIRKTNDVIIASFCIENKLPLLFVDRDFFPFVKYLGLLSVI